MSYGYLATLEEVIWSASLAGGFALGGIALGWWLRTQEAMRQRSHQRAMDRWRLLSETYGAFMGEAAILESGYLRALKTGQSPTSDPANIQSGKIKVVGSPAVVKALGDYVTVMIDVYTKIMAVRKAARQPAGQPGPKIDIEPVIFAGQERQAAMLRAMQKHLADVLSGDDEIDGAS